MHTTTDSVLVVDDDDLTRSLVRELLERVGYTVVERESGRDALDFFEHGRAAVVLLDVNLPGLNGYEVCRQIRDRFDDTIGVILMSGERTETYDRTAGLMIGADDYVAKPFDPSELVERVRRLAPAPTPRDPRAAGRLRILTARERQVLTLLADGMDQHDIAAELGISPKTVATHIQRVLGKLRVRSRAQAVSVVWHEAARESGEST